MSVSRAIQACRDAGLPVVDPDGCSCGLRGQLVVLAGPDGLRVEYPYYQTCPIHGRRLDARQSAKRDRLDQAGDAYIHELATSNSAVGRGN